MVDWKVQWASICFINCIWRPNTSSNKSFIHIYISGLNTINDRPTMTTGWIWLHTPLNWRVGTIVKRVWGEGSEVFQFGDSERRIMDWCRDIVIWIHEFYLSLPWRRLPWSARAPRFTEILESTLASLRTGKLVTFLHFPLASVGWLLGPDITKHLICWISAGRMITKMDYLVSLLLVLFSTPSHHLSSMSYFFMMPDPLTFNDLVVLFNWESNSKVFFNLSSTQFEWTS